MALASVSPSGDRKSGYIAIIGRPNAGKSTLLNRVLGSRLSIVTAKAQTTRENILGFLTEKSGQMVFIDTPGIHKAKAGGINAYMVERAAEAIESPNIIWYLVDPSSALEFEAPVLELLEKSKSGVILIINKVDRVRSPAHRDKLARFQVELEKAIEARGVVLHSSYQISSLEGDGVGELLQSTWALLPQGPIYYPDEDQISDRPVRYFVSEKIREQLYLLLGEELPYSCAVKIEKFQEKSKPVRIEAVIYVERDSQKGIVVGKGGAKIKEIGMAARQEIEAFLEKKIFLGLQVKVLKDWTRDSERLKQLGYSMNERPAAI